LNRSAEALRHPKPNVEKAYAPYKTTPVPPPSMVVVRNVLTGLQQLLPSSLSSAKSVWQYSS
jgi:hypothetical protein